MTDRRAPREEPRRAAEGSRRKSGEGRSPNHDVPERVGEVLSEVLRKLGVTREVASQGALLRWAEVVGDQIAAVTRPRSVSSGVLFVEVRTSAWLTELNLMRHEILRRLNAGQGEGRVDRLVFVLSDGRSGMERAGVDR